MQRRPQFPGYGSLVAAKKATTSLNYGRHVIRRWADELTPAKTPLRVLDIGCGTGIDLLATRDVVKPREAELYGVDSHPDWRARASELGILVADVDIEKESLPHGNAHFDLVIANQILEHTKEVFWVLAEVHRVLRVGGHVVIGVPNLASLHNRILLLLGEQPSSIEPIGPHVRGFTLPALKRLLTASGHFAVVATAGSNFYPFPGAVAGRLSSIWASASVSIFVAAEKTAAEGTFLATIQADMDRATPFYKGR